MWRPQLIKANVLIRCDKKYGMMLVPGTNGELAIKISRKFGKNPEFIQIERFPYGEKYVRIPFEVPKSAVVVNTFHPNPDEIIFESRLIGETLKDKGAKELVLVAPYLAYSKRKTTIFGEADSLDTAMNILDVYDRIITVDFYGKTARVENVSAMPLLAEYISREYSIDNPVVLGPDEISSNWIDTFADILGGEPGIIRKIRIDAENVVVSTISGDVDGRDVVIADDIIATGATVIQSAKKLKSIGARRIFVASTHALLNREVYAEMLKAGVEDIVSTDTVISLVSRVSVAELLAEAI